MRTCDLVDCGRRHKARGLCNLHYQRVLKHGDFTCVIVPGHSRRGSNHPLWQDEVGYRAAHQRIVSARGKATTHPCADCGEPAVEWAFDRPTGYSIDPTRYRPLCKACHVAADRISGENRGFG